MKQFIKKNDLSITFDFPENVEYIELINCPLIKRIEIPNTVKILKCINCIRLNNVIVPNNVESINFNCCFSLSNIVLNEGLLRIDTDGFKGCKNLKNIYIPDSVVEFGECNSIYDSVESVGCFENYTIVNFEKPTATETNIIIENEKLKRQVKQYQKIINVLQN